MTDSSTLSVDLPRATGRRCWAIAEGYLPGWSHGPEPELASHETLCLLNTGAAAAELAPWVKGIEAIDREASMLNAAQKRLSAHDHVRFHESDLLTQFGRLDRGSLAGWSASDDDEVELVVSVLLFRAGGHRPVESFSSATRSSLRMALEVFFEY